MKAFNSNLEKYIISCIESDKEGQNELDYFFERFDEEFNYAYNVKRLPSYIDRLEDFLRGLPINFACENYEIKATAKALGYKFNNELQESNFIENWFNRIARALRLMYSKRLLETKGLKNALDYMYKGLTFDNHCSDLYVTYTPDVYSWIHENYSTSSSLVSTFICQVSGVRMIEVAFAYIDEDFRGESLH